MTPAISAEPAPTNSEMRKPYMMPDSMSRPWSSVPSQNFMPSPLTEPGDMRPSMMSSCARS